MQIKFSKKNLKQIKEEFGDNPNYNDFVFETINRKKTLIHVPSGCPVGTKSCEDCIKMAISCFWF